MEGLKRIRVRREEEEGREEQPLSPVARMFHESHSNVYIIVFLGFNIPIDYDLFKANMKHTFLKHPRFSYLQVMDEKRCGEMKWVKAEINLDNHIIVPKIDHSNIESPDKFVEDYAFNMSKTKLSKSIPMWDLHLLNIKTSDAESVAILRVHHSLGDGLSLMSLLLSTSRKISDPNSLPTFPTAKKRNIKDDSGSGIWQFIIKLWMVLVLCWNTFVDMAMLLFTLFSLEDTKTPIKGSDSCSAPRRFVHTTISLDDVKLVKNAMSVTINDVMVGVTQGALSQYLNRRYGEILHLNKKYGDDRKEAKATKSKKNLPKNIRLRASFIVNIRPDSGIHALDDMTRKGSKAKWGNKVSFVLYPFTIALRDDPLDYVRDAKLVGERKKASLEAICAYLGNKFLFRYCGIKRFGFPTRTTLCFSNVPGPREQISLAGHPLAFVVPTCYGLPNALMIHVVSYVNKMKIILSVDESIIPDPYQLCDDFQNSFKLIKNAVVAKAVVAN